MRDTIKKFTLGMTAAMAISLPFTAHAADATSFNPTTVKVTAKPISSIPVGTIISWPVAQDPADMRNPDGTFNWLECNGQTISQAAYPELFAVLGGKVPDLRGLFLRGHGGNSAALGTRQGYAMKDFLGHGELEVSFGGSLSGNGIFKHLSTRRISAPAASWGGWNSEKYGIDLSAGGLPVSNEVRPDNMAVRYLVRARP